MIRTGAETAEVEALFDASDSPAARRFLAASGAAEESGEEGPAPDARETVARRMVAASGRNRAWISGRIESAGRLFELGRTLVDIYGQHEHQTLLKQEMHLNLLDSFGNHDDKLSNYRAAYEKWRQAEKELSELSMDDGHGHQGVLLGPSIGAAEGDPARGRFRA